MEGHCDSAIHSVSLPYTDCCLSFLGSSDMRVNFMGHDRMSPCGLDSGRPDLIFLTTSTWWRTFVKACQQKVNGTSTKRAVEVSLGDLMNDCRLICFRHPHNAVVGPFRRPKVRARTAVTLRPRSVGLSASLFAPVRPSESGWDSAGLLKTWIQGTQDEYTELEGHVLGDIWANQDELDASQQLFALACVHASKEHCRDITKQTRLPPTLYHIL